MVSTLHSCTVRQGCTRAFHVSAASAAMLRTSQSGRRVPREGSVAIGRCARPPWHSGEPSNQFAGQCGISASARLRENGRAHGWANGGAASRAGCRGASCSDTGRCSGTAVQADWPSSRRRVLAVTAPACSLGAIVSVAACGGCCGGTRHGHGAAHAAHDDVAAVRRPRARSRARAADVVAALADAFRRVSQWKPRDAPQALPKPAAEDPLCGLRRSSAQRLTSAQGGDTMQGCCLVGAGVAKAFIPTKASACMPPCVSRCA
jgi:hypothetical protein